VQDGGQSTLASLVGQSIHPSSRAQNKNSCTGKEKDAMPFFTLFSLFSYEIYSYQVIPHQRAYSSPALFTLTSDSRTQTYDSMLLAYSSAQELRAHSLTLLREGRRQVDGTDRREGERFLTLKEDDLALKGIPLLQLKEEGFVLE